MKTKKSKKSKSSKKIKSSVSEPGLVLTAHGDYREEDLEFWPRPTEWQLAQLAAQLSRSDKLDAKQLIHDAWEIYWEGCRKIQNDHRDQKAWHERESATDMALNEWIHQPQPAVPQPKKFPVAFREMEILLLPGKYGHTAERAHLIREYVLSEFLGTCLVLRPKPHPLTYWELDPTALNELREHFSGQVDAKFGHYRAQHFNEDAYIRFADSFLKWHRRYITEKRSAAARTRWDPDQAAENKAVSETIPAVPKKSLKKMRTSS
jgi:hypothetical protein